MFSANSEVSLRAQVDAYHRLLESPDSPDPVHVAVTLAARRSQHSVRVAFAGHDRPSLMQSLQSYDPHDSLGVRIDRKVVETPRILGVFTGQGAQWPGMGRELLRTSSVAREIVHRLQDSLAQLPDPPSWSLADEMQADAAATSSRLAEASVAQPLCTAVQVILVDLLQLAGVTFTAVVGHSSGEIGAAYAAGMITAQDAIRIAYYRGVHARLARGDNGQRGAMLAAGMGYDKACDFCARHFPGRLDVAASNAPGSVTLSGNADAVEEARALLADDQGRFARPLRVDTAYHYAPHMAHCSDPYLQSLAACHIRPRPARDGCSWVSSVHGYRMHGDQHVQTLAGEYWNDNMLNPVLFSLAVEAALSGGLSYHVALELGPHPALKVPFTQTSKQMVGADEIPYSGTLSRGRHDVHALSDTLGFLWKRLGASAVDYGRYASAFSLAPKWIPDLPGYVWDHRQAYWRESNKSRNFRRRPRPRHPLLGVRSPEDTDQTPRWTQTLRLGELPWLEGHKVQGQVVYPAAAYLVMAMEACHAVATDRAIELLELVDVDMANAIALSDEEPAVDISFSLTPSGASSSSSSSSRTTIADWACYARAAPGKAAWRLNARGSVRMVWGPGNDHILPPRAARDEALVDVDVDRFYEALTDIGLGYTGAFRALDSLRRRSGCARATLRQSPSHPVAHAIHPAILDAAFQTVFAALCSPGDGSLRTPFVPTRLSCLRIANAACVQRADQLLVGAAIIAEDPGLAISADLDVYSSSSSSSSPGQGNNHALVQIQGLRCSCLTPPGPMDYKELYSHTEWLQDIGSGIASRDAVSSHDDAPGDLHLVELCERFSYYYLRQLNAAIARSEVPTMEWNFQRIFEWIDHLFPWIESGTHPTIRKEWASDDPSWLLDQAARFFPDSIDLQLITAVGTHLPQVVRRETTMLEHMVHNDVLDRFYKFGLGFQRANGFLGQVARQIAHRYPRARILEVGAGTGGATKAILESLGESSFESYTYTDISTGFFEAAAAAFEPWAHKMIFRPLNVESDLAEQGFGDNQQSFDVIVASNVLHATQNLAATMRNVRRLLKPGGFLVLLEVTSAVVRVKLMMSGLPGWWLGGEDGRHHGPTISADQWDVLLKTTGFSGVDHLLHDFVDAAKHMTSVMVSQAINDNVRLLRQPLHHSSSSAAAWSLPPTVIVGGRTSSIALHIQRMLAPLARQVHCVDDLADLLARSGAALQAPVLVILEDLDANVLETFSQSKLAALQQAVPQCRRLLWVSSHCLSGNPYGNMSVGLCRALAAEHPHIALQHLDLEAGTDDSTPSVIAEAIVRLAFGADPHRGEEQLLLWTSEPELRVTKNGQILIPRILPDHRLNDRLNAQKGIVVATSSSVADGVDILPQANRFVLSEPVPSVVDAHVNQVQVDVAYSLTSAVRLAPHTAAFVSYGSLKDNGDVQVVAFSTTNASTVATAPTCVFPISSAAPAPAFVQTVAFAALAERLLSGVSPGQAVLLHEADEKLGAVVQQRAGELGVRVAHLSVHPYASLRALQQAVPASARLVLDFAPKSTAALRWERIVSPDCEVVRVEDLFTHTPSPEGSSISSVADLLDKSFTWTRQHVTIMSKVEEEEATLIPLADLAGRPLADIPYASVVGFPGSGVLAVVTRPLDPARLFRPDRTYLLAGCTGGLGQALCRWMVSHGARFLALTSRNPDRVSATWLHELRHQGAQVTLLAADVADKASLSEACAHVGSSMPPIAGVANAAMVLADRSFTELRLDDFRAVWGPKVEGTKNLDELFHGCPLDFFIMFSSLASIVGNRGQSNYVAANLFMSTIAEQRRQRGLAASVLHIGMVLGVGYVSSTGIYESTLRQYNYMPIAEAEFLDMFSEAILMGRAAAHHSPELITGLNRHSLRDDVQKPFWHENLRFSHHTVAESSLHHQTESAASASGTGKASLSQSIQEAATLEQVHVVIQDAFCSKIERMLQAAKDSVERHQPLINLGVDSLIAVEIRSWFLKELDVDLPVLKVLGGASLAELCLEAASKVWKEEDDTAAPQIEVPVPSSPSPADAAAAAAAAAAAKSSTPEVPATKGESSRHLQPPESLAMAEPSSSATSVIDSSASSRSRSSSPSPPPSEKKGEEARDAVRPPEEPQIERRSAMSFAQERLWFLRGYLRDPTTYNVTISYSVTGPLDFHALQDAFHAVIRRHESLRTCFYTDPETNCPTQAALAQSNFQVESRVGVASVEAEFNAMRHHIYDLENGQSLRAVLIPDSPSQQFLVIGFHHIAFDGFSAQTLIRDLTMAYAGQPLPAAPPQYIDFTAEQRAEAPELALRDLEYWKQEFPDLPPTLPLLDFAETKTRAPLTEYQLRSITRTLPSDVTGEIRSIARNLSSTPFHVHLSVLQAVLHRLLSVDDVCIGVTDANKNNHARFMETIGFFVNLLPIRFRLGASSSFADLVTQAKEKTYHGLAHSRVSVDKLLDALRVPRATSHHPLFQIAINYKMNSTQTVPLGQCQARMLDFVDARNAYDLHFEIEMLSDGATHLTVQTQRYLYTDHELSVVVDTYLHLLRVLCQDPHRKINAVDLAPPGASERALQLSRGSMNFFSPPQFPTLSRCVQHWASIQPAVTATLDDQGASLSYAQVVAGADELARQLVGAGVKPGDRVGVYCEPSSNLVMYICGIHKAGGIYVPLDVQNPVSRLKLMVNDCQMALILCDEMTAPRAADLDTDATTVTNFMRQKSIPQSSPPFPDLSDGSSPACILYTSGTTGTPKGVVVSHSNLAYHAAALREQLGLAQETVLQQTSWGFDVSLGETYQGILGGGCLVVASSSTRRDPARLARLMRQEKVTFTIMTPTQALSLARYGSDDLRQCSHWRFALNGGEVFPSHLVDVFQSLDLPSLQVFITYGPTEGTVIAACQEANNKLNSRPSASSSDTRNPSIGQTLPNYSSYVLDDSQRPVPVGFAGELCLGGAGVALGYLHRDDLTASKFLFNPYAEPAWLEKGWDRMYRTGDKVKYLPDGRLVYLGRMAGDAQRKLRGFRIELGDIARTIVQTSAGRVGDAAASIRGDLGDSSNQFLVAFAVPSASESLSDSSLVSFLENLRTSLPLPQYMCPSRIVAVDSLPMSSSGKLDQAAVDAMPIPALPTEHHAAGHHLSATQLQLKELWMDTLPRISGDSCVIITADTDFFGVGGNSLLLVQLQSRIARQLNVTVPVFDLFQASTLGAMASKLDAASPDRASSQSVMHINWDEETLPPSLPSTAATSDRTERSTHQATTNLEILLTGATGFLGSALLRQLVADPDVAKIHCVAIRPASDGTPRPLAVSCPKITQYAGDLSLPLLGLLPEQYTQLSQRIHRIIHNGATVSFMRSYLSLRAPNVNSTKALATLSLSRHIPFHFVSSAGVANLTGLDGLLPPASVATSLPPSDGKDGYSSSKWASEVYLERCADAHQLPVCIHRPSSITGTGAPETDLMQRIIHASLAIHALPALSSSWRGSFDWVPVDEVAAGVVASLHHTDSSTARLSFVHHCADRKIPVSGLKAHLEAEHGLEINTLSAEEWFAEVTGQGLLDVETEPLVRDVLDRKDGVLPGLKK